MPQSVIDGNEKASLAIEMRAYTLLRNVRFGKL